MRIPFFRKRRYQYRVRAKRKNWLPILLFLGVVFLFLWAIYYFVSILFSGSSTESLSAELQVLQGRSSFSLYENNTWTPAYSEQKFLTGDSIRTESDSRIALKIAGGSEVFLDENSELEFLVLEQHAPTEKYIILKLKKGQMWARISDDGLKQETPSRFEIHTDRIELHVRGTIFNLSTDDNEDIIRLAKGAVDIDVIADEQSVNTKVGVGQRLTVTSETFEKIKNGEEVLEIIDSEFTESEWHLKNLEKFYPQETLEIRRRIELMAAQKEAKNESELKESSSLPAPEILSPKENEHFGTSTDTLKVEGTAPEEAVQIVVNGFTLTKFQPGDRKWSYFAARKFGTLVPGENIFSVYAISREGEKSETATVKVHYEKDESAAGGEISNTSKPSDSIKNDSNGKDVSIGSLGTEEFKAPVIVKPAVIINEGTHETSSNVVTLVGTVDPKTNTVKVNGYTLKKFNPGDPTFTYIASSMYGRNSNLKEGANRYEILAMGPDKKNASTVINVIYKPVNVDAD